jgi:phosphomevalonate kinase
MNNIYLPWRNSQLKKELKICQEETEQLILKNQEEEKSKKKLEELTTLKRDMITAQKSYRDIERQIIEKRFKKEDSMKLTKKLEELATEFERLKKLVKLVDPAEYD